MGGFIYYRSGCVLHCTQCLERRLLCVVDACDACDVHICIKIFQAQRFDARTCLSIPDLNLTVQAPL